MKDKSLIILHNRSHKIVMLIRFRNVMMPDWLTKIPGKNISMILVRK